jgi:hypothetical protein
LRLASGASFGKMKFTPAIMSAFGSVPECADDVDREIRIEKMKRELDELSGGLMISGSFRDVPMGTRGDFSGACMREGTLRHEF